MYSQVKEYYGKVLKNSSDLKTDACCTTMALPIHVKKALANVHEEVISRYYGCGLVVPQVLEGAHILDLGSGAGRDCYTLSQLVGESGFVLGIDMTDEQLEVAFKYSDHHREKFGYAKSNVDFRKGYLEHLDELALPDGSFDIIVSNCVINLSPDKSAVLRNVFRLLKPGGEMYFSDVYADRHVPKKLSDDQELLGECLGGALYWNDFLTKAKAAGFTDPRLFENRALEIRNKSIQEKVGLINFYSATYRLFKISGLEPSCEDYGQAVIYQGTVKHHPNRFTLDKNHVFDKGKVCSVCGNTYKKHCTIYLVLRDLPKNEAIVGSYRGWNS